MASFFKKLAKATPTLTQGLVQGVKLRQDMEDSAFRREQAMRAAGLQEQQLGLQNLQLAAAAKKAEDDRMKALADEYTSGIVRKDGAIASNPDFMNPGSDLYKHTSRAAELKRTSPAASAPRMSWGQIYAQIGKPMPQGLNPGDLAPDSVAARIIGGSPGGNLTADQIRALQRGELTGDVGVAPGYANFLRDMKPKAPLGYRYDSSGNLEAIPGGPAAKPRLNTAPPGYRFTADGNLEPIPGGPAIAQQEAAQLKTTQEKKKAAEADEKMAKGKASQQRKFQTAIQDATRALDIVGKQTPGKLGGIQQALTGFIPGTDAADLEQLLETVKTIGGFGELQAMRDASPTGGALGQVSDSENRMLQATLGNLGRLSSPQQRSDNLKRIINMYYDAYYGEDQGPKRYELNFDEMGRAKTPSDSRANAAKLSAAPPADVSASAKRLGMAPETVAKVSGKQAITDEDSKIADYASKYNISFERAKSIIEKRRASGQK